MKQRKLSLIIFLTISVASGDKLYLKNGLVYEGKYEGMAQGKLIFIYAVTNSRIRFDLNDIMKITDDDGIAIMTGEETIDQLKSGSQHKPVKKSALRGFLSGSEKAPFAIAQKRGLSVWVKPTYLDVSGADLHLLDKILERVDLSSPGEVLYRIGTDRVDLQQDRIWTPFLGAEYDFGNRWKIYGDILRLSAVAKESDVFQAPDSTATVKYFNSVHLWEGNFRLPFERNFSFRNDKHPSGYSPIDWSGKTDFKITSGNLYTSYSLFSEINYTLNLNFGLKFLSMNQTLNRSIDAEVYLYSESDIDGDGIVEDMENDVFLSTRNVADMNLSLGPRMGMSGGLKHNRWLFQGSLSQAWVGVKVDVEGDFKDIDDIKWYVPPGYRRFILRYDGSLTFDENIETIVPVLTVIANVSYHLTKNWALGLEGYYSVWKNVPTVPTFSYRDTTWRTHNDDLSVAGISLTFRFTIPKPSRFPKISPPPQDLEDSPREN